MVLRHRSRDADRDYRGSRHPPPRDQAPGKGAREQHLRRPLPEARRRFGGSPVIKDQLPAIFHWKDHAPGEVHPDVREAFARYRETLAPAHRMLLDRYEIKDAAIKVVGVGSVGTACLVLLLMAGEGDPLILQVKEARASVLEAYAGKSVFPNHGQRVVNGHRLMQPASDIFLGWTEGG